MSDSSVSLSLSHRSRTPRRVCVLRSVVKQSGGQALLRRKKRKERGKGEHVEMLI